jgi:uncharacterized protein (TIGR03435 family)
MTRLQIFFFACLTLTAQKLPEFEVATIKPVVPDQMHRVGLDTFPDGRIVFPTVTLRGLIITAFQLSAWQISGADDWMVKTEYDVEAKVSPAMLPQIKTLKHTWFDLDDPTLRQMLQALLIDRFQLKFHRDTKQATVYLLKQSGKPVTLVPSAIQPATDSPDNKPGPSGNMGYAARRWAISNMSIQDIAKFATDFVLHTPILDQTGLSGTFDYRQPPNTDSEADSVDQTASFLRLISELGLKLETTRGPVETLVVDSAAKPSEN